MGLGANRVRIVIVSDGSGDKEGGSAERNIRDTDAAVYRRMKQRGPLGCPLIRLPLAEPAFLGLGELPRPVLRLFVFRLAAVDPGRGVF